MDHLSGWLAGGAIIGILASCWTYIKDMVKKLISTLIQRAELDNTSSEVLSYMIRNYKLSKVYDKKYHCSSILINTVEHGNNTHGYVPYEMLGNQMLIFWKGWVPIIYNKAAADIKTGAAATSSLLYLRGTFNLSDIIGKAFVEYNERGWNWDKRHNNENRRFFVKHIPDFESEEDKNKPIKNTTSWNLPWWQLDCNKVLGYDPNILGYQPKQGIKALERLIFPPSVNESIEEIKIWRDNKEWHQKRGIPWKRGWLLYGLPGTGKTALARAFAEDLDMPVFVFNLAELGNFSFMKNWLSMNTAAPCIALIEDIDNVFHGRKNITSNGGGGMMMGSALLDYKRFRKRKKTVPPPIKSDNKADSPDDKTTINETDDDFSFGGCLNFDVFINMLDGIDRSEGIFTIITTNHIEYIDEALGQPVKHEDGKVDFVSSRPGRIDRAIELTCMRPQDKLIMAERILGEYEVAYKEMLIQLELEGDNKQETPAQFQDRCAQIAIKCFWVERNEAKVNPITVENEKVVDAIPACVELKIKTRPCELQYKVDSGNQGYKRQYTTP